MKHHNFRGQDGSTTILHEAQFRFRRGCLKSLAGWILMMSAFLVLVWFLLIPPPTEAQIENTLTPIAPSTTPTTDRLAAPPTVENPTQADNGAQLYWLHCQPCHGDVGQGLTEEWRAQYPPEDQNCWESGCHGNRPYENGFTLPEVVPPVTGNGSLLQFETLGQLYTFTRNAMPYQMPGHLSDEEYLAIVAFLARAHEVDDGLTLNIENVNDIHLRPMATPSRDGQSETVLEEESEIEQAVNEPISVLQRLSIIVFLIIVAVAVGIWLWRRHRH